MKQVLLFFGLLVIAAVLYVGGMLLLGVATKFKPAAVETVELVNSKTQASASVADTSFSFLIWNVGYGGLGKEVDFFYDGGKMVTSPKEHVLKNNAGMVKFFEQNRDVDFIMLQEVDRNSKRSWKIDQAEQFAKALPEHNYAFTPNYDVQYLPFPFTDPMGRVYGGLQTLSKYTPVESKRIALPGITDFPRKLFYLERCLLQQRYKLANGKDLVVINTHFEAYDDGSVKKEQMALTKKILEEEYAKGNYVVIGGDWNIAPPAFNVHTWEKEPEDDQLYLKNNDPDYVKGWSYVYDSTTATNRKNKYAFGAKTFTTVIDYYFTSPNIEIEEVKGVDMGFDFSDHQPVKLRIKLK
ncbi:MAG TPA: endonuclease/exonuclease/phosphatase family protein [Chitinophagales bacterium]|nr:endonuclease/exonuclease/phosphatase family protein [Chitinophagales bacterium]